MIEKPSRMDCSATGAGSPVKVRSSARLPNTVIARSSVAATRALAPDLALAMTQISGLPAITSIAAPDGTGSDGAIGAQISVPNEIATRPIAFDRSRPWSKRISLQRVCQKDNRLPAFLPLCRELFVAPGHDCTQGREVRPCAGLPRLRSVWDSRYTLRHRRHRSWLG